MKERGVKGKGKRVKKENVKGKRARKMIG